MSRMDPASVMSASSLSVKWRAYGRIPAPPRSVAMATSYYVLNATEEARLLKRVNGKGGFQSFMRDLQKSYRKGSQELPHLSDEDLDQMQRYAFDYRQGGWEDDLKTIFAR